MAEATISRREPRPQFICEECLTPFTRYPSAAKKGNPRFCTYSCCSTYRRRTGDYPATKAKIAFKCETCGKEGEARQSEVDQRFCSQECMLVWRAEIISAKRYQPEKHVVCTCKWCGKTFQTHRCRLDGSRGKYCSRQCLGSASVRKQGRVSIRETDFGVALKLAGASVLPQHRIGRWTVDFYSPSFGVAIEFDGEYWHGTTAGIDRDKRKDKVLKAKGIRVVRVPERLWLDDPEAAVQLAISGLRRAA